MATLSGSYRIDRLNPPKFYTPKQGKQRTGMTPGVTVLAVTNRLATPRFVTVGYVSKQTPFGQGIYHGINMQHLRGASVARQL